MPISAENDVRIVLVRRLESDFFRTRLRVCTTNSFRCGFFKLVACTRKVFLMFLSLRATILGLNREEGAK